MAFRVLWIILYFSTISSLDYVRVYTNAYGDKSIIFPITRLSQFIGDKYNYRLCLQATLYIYILFFLIDFIKYKSISILYYYLCAMALLFIYIFSIIASLTNIGE